MTTEKNDKLIYELVPKVMAEIGAIGKQQENQFDHYKFRGIDDVYNAVQPALVKHGLFFVPTLESCEITAVTTSQGKPAFRAIVQMLFALTATDGSSITARTVGEAMDRGDKACNKAMSAAYKYAIFQLFCIPTEGDNDSENQTYEVEEQPAPAKPPVDMKGLKSPQGEKFLRRYADASSAIREIAKTKDVQLEAEAYIQEFFETEAVLPI